MRSRCSATACLFIAILVLGACGEPAEDLERCPEPGSSCPEARGDAGTLDSGSPSGGVDASAPEDACGPHGVLEGPRCRCDPGYAQTGSGEGIFCTEIPACTRADDTYEPNDEPALATRLGGPGVVDAYVCPATGDWYVLSVEAGDTVLVEATFDGEAVDIDLYLFGPTSPDPVDASLGTGDLERVRFTTPRAGSAGIFVRVYGIGEGAYQLQIDVLEGEPPRCAPPGALCRVNADCCSSDCHIGHCH